MSDIEKPQRVKVVGFDVSIGELIVFLLKLMIASIPAAIIAFVFFAVLSAVLAGVGMTIFGKH